MKKRFIAAIIAACTTLSSVPVWAQTQTYDSAIATEEQTQASGVLEIAGQNVYYALKSEFNAADEVVITKKADESKEESKDASKEESKEVATEQEAASVTLSKRDMTLIEGSDVYYFVDEKVDDVTYYGTATFSYTDFYTNKTSVKEYDAVTSATTRKNNIFSNEDSTQVTEEGYSILGVKNVNVSVNAKTYIEAQVLSKTGKIPETGVYTKAAAITLNNDAKEAKKQLKVLNSDGTYSDLELNVVSEVKDATATLNTSSRYGDYEVDVKETTTNFIKSKTNSVENGAKIGSDIEGIILESTDGDKVGMRHLKEMWVNPGDIAFDVDSAAGQKFVGKDISKVTFITQDETYVYELSQPVHIVPQADTSNVKAVFSEDLKSIKIENLPSDIVNPILNVFVKVDKRTTNYYVEDASLTGIVEITGENQIESGKAYSVTIKSDNYADIKLNGTVYGFNATLAQDSFPYDKTAKKPEVKIEGLEEVSNDLYDVSYDYSNNVNAGKAQVVVTVADKNGYAVSKVLNFNIVPASISKLNATLAKTSYTYANKAYTPAVTIAGLKKGTDYTVSYSNNKNAGKATVTITGKGNYTGKITKTFTIGKKATKLTVKKNSYTVKQNAKAFNLGATSNGDGKITYVSSNKKIATVDSKGKVTIVKNAVGTATITVKAAAGKNSKAATTKVKIVVKPSDIAKLNLKSAKKKLTLTWTANKASVGYEVQYSLKANFKGAKTRKTSKATLVLSKLTSNKVYYVRVRAYKKVGNTTYYSAYKTGKAKVK